MSPSSPHSVGHAESELEMSSPPRHPLPPPPGGSHLISPLVRVSAQTLLACLGRSARHLPPEAGRVGCFSVPPVSPTAGNQSLHVACADFPGVNSPTVADSKPPTRRHWGWGWEETETSSIGSRGLLQIGSACYRTGSSLPAAQWLFSSQISFRVCLGGLLLHQQLAVGHFPQMGTGGHIAHWAKLWGARSLSKYWGGKGQREKLN